MTTTQIRGARNFYEEVTRPEETMTAREMALIKHSLLCGGNVADVPDGSTFKRFRWIESRQLWVR